MHNCPPRNTFSTRKNTGLQNTRVTHEKPRVYITKRIRKRTLAVETPVLTKGRMNIRRIGRIIACQALFAYEFQKEVSTDLLCIFEWDTFNRKSAKEFAASLVYGALEKREEIDVLIIEKLQGWEFDRITPINKAILRLSLFSLLFDNDVPAAVTIDEAVDLAKLFSDPEDYKFINAVLDKIADEKGKINTQQ